MATSAEQIRAYRGPALFSYGFRPLFLAGGLWAMLAMALWVVMLTGRWTLPTAFAGVDWHSHELLFGYVPVVMAGFLLTAVPNWTGRLPIVGPPLLMLCLIWLAGRLAVAFSALIGPLAAAIIDIGFLVTLGALIAREIIAGKNWRNLKVLILVAALALANAGFHWEAAHGSIHYAARAGLALILMLIMVIGGRIIPSFTRNWLTKRGPGALPAPFDRFDVAAMVLAGVALLLWCVMPAHGVTALALTFAALAHLWRLWRWAGWRTAAEPLVLVLHGAYLFIPLGFALAALDAAQIGPVLPAAAIHSWTAGAVGLMTLAVMTRASLGHSGRPLQSTPAITMIYAAVALSALLRIVAGLGFGGMGLIHAAGTFWLVGFALFTGVFWPILARPKR